MNWCVVNVLFRCYTCTYIRPGNFGTILVKGIAERIGKSLKGYKIRTSLKLYTTIAAVLWTAKKAITHVRAAESRNIAHINFKTWPIVIKQ